MNAVIETIGKAKVHQVEYAKSDWQERDNFETIEQAREYAQFKCRMYPVTPYRIRQLRGRFAVEFVPEWNLR